ncbi:MAG TPA: hypothetical protein VF544_21370 [Pyrinomonadaceae bacterium]
MSTSKCSCSALERLEGASVPAYIKAFLDQSNGEKNRYRCRVCGREWERRAPEIRSAGTRPSLVRL